MDFWTFASTHSVAAVLIVLAVVLPGALVTIAALFFTHYDNIEWTWDRGRKGRAGNGVEEDVERAEGEEKKGES